MPNTFLRQLVGGALLAASCVAPLLASQQDDARNRRVSPAARPAAQSASVQPAVAQPATTTAVRKYQITASEGQIVPGHIRVRHGESIRIVFVSRDDTYGIRFKDFGVKEKLTPEKPVIIELRPEKPGTYEFRCTRTWGVSHWTHNGALVVE